MSNYPNAIDYFRRVVNYISGAILAVNKVTADDQNNMADTVEAIETTLGTNPEGSEVDVKTRLDAIDGVSGSVASKVSKDGDTMTGNLEIEDDAVLFKSASLDGAKINYFYTGADRDSVEITNTTPDQKPYLLVMPQENDVESRFGMSCGPYASSSGFLQIVVDTEATKITTYYGAGIFLNAELSVFGGLLIYNRIEFDENSGNYIRMTTPDKTKQYDISIDNSGAVITTLVV